MADLSDLIRVLMESTPGKRRRTSISEGELDRRLEIYREQNEAFDITHEHEAAFKSIFRDLDNVFITGGAGTGKTSLVRDIIIPELEHRGLNFAVTATTGIAGSHLSGKTIHSWAGIGLGPYFPPSGTPPQERDPDNLREFYQTTYDEWNTSSKGGFGMRDGVRKRIRGTEVLLIDEISMCAGAGLLGYLDFFFKKIRDKNAEAFGGIQIIFIGDFHQLSPVEKGRVEVPDWAFLSEAWRAAGIRTHELTRVFRQSDKEFADFLNKVRKGDPTDPEYLRKFVRQLTLEEAMCASYLVPTNAQADKLNNMVLNMYPAPTVSLAADFRIEPQLLASYETPDKVRKQLVQAMRSKETLHLRAGVPVLLKINDRSGRYVNGTKGFVTGFLNDRMLPETNPEAVTLIEVTIPKRGDVEELRVMVARHVTTRNPKEDHEEVAMVNDPVTGALKAAPRWPQALQFPLIPATSITVHSSQGMSLDECVVDLRQSFAAGHAYVAMSRLRSASGLTLTSDEFDVKVDPSVLRFYRNTKKK